MRTMACLALALLLTAGCSEPGKAPTDSTPSMSSSSSSTSPQAVGNATPPAAPLASFSFTDCSNRGGVFSVPRAAADAVLPEGFEPVASTNDPRGNGAVVYAIIVTCQTSLVNGTEQGLATFGYAELAVTPPSELQVDGITDCTVPLAFLSSQPAFGDLLGELRMGLSGLGTHDEQTALTNGVGATIQALSMGSASLDFMFGEGLPDTLGVGGGDFVLYGVQDQQVTSIVKGTAAGGSAHYVPARFEATEIAALEEVTPAALGFAAAGFSLTFVEQPLPQMA